MTYFGPTHCHYYHGSKIELETKIYGRKQNLSEGLSNMFEMQTPSELTVYYYYYYYYFRCVFHAIIRTLVF